MKRALPLLLSLFFCLAALGQKTNAGTEFWMGFLKNYTASSNYLKLYISATNTTKVYLRVPLQNYIDSITVPKDSVRIIQVPNNLGNILDYDTAVRKAIQITSNFPISVAAMNLQTATTDASIILPTVNIPPGASYIVGSPNSSGFGNEFMLVASEDSTRVTIIPTSTTSRGHTANIPYTVKLNKGELYQVSGTSLTGSVIKVLSNTKVAVFSGDVCSNFPCGACDHQYEQIVPNILADTSYYIPPHFGHTLGYQLKIVPIDSNISIEMNGYTMNNLSRHTPVVVNVKGDSGYYIRSNKLFHVFQFMKGPSCNGYITSGYGDPAMLEILSNKYMGTSAMFSTVNSTNLRDHFVSIVINSSSKNNVYLDKTKIDSSEFKPFPYDSKRSYACVRINLGTHLVECADGMLAYCYGIGSYESYLYLAGFNLPNFDLDFKDSVIYYDCKNQRINMQFRAIASRPLKSYTWHFGDNTTGSGLITSHLYDTLGMIPVKLVGEDFSGKKDSVTKYIRVDWPVFDPVRNKIICGIDTVTFIEPNPFFTNFKWQDSSTNNFYKAWENKSIWVFATDTSGYCKFVDTGVIAKIEIFNSLIVDTIDHCFKTNLFRFKESTQVFADQIYHRAWVFPFTTVWDTSEVLIKFPMPGKYMVYYDIYTLKENCKARYPMEITVHPNPKAFTNQYGDLYCSGESILFKDSSQIVTGSIDHVKWIFDDNTTSVSDSGRTYKSFKFNPATGEVIRHFTQVPNSDHGCTDSLYSAVNIWPSPISGFTINASDTIRCLPGARWTFNSTTKAIYDSFALFWDMGNGIKGTSKDMRNIRYNSPGVYKIKLVAKDDQNNCEDSTIKYVEVLKVPEAKIHIPDTMQCYTSNAFDFHDSSDGKYLKAYWTIDSGYTDTNHLIQGYHFPKPGKFKVRLLVDNGYVSCTDAEEKYVHVLSNPKSAISINEDTQCLKGNNFILTNVSQYFQTRGKTEWRISILSTGISYGDTNFNIASYVAPDTGNYSVMLISNDQELCADTTYSALRVSNNTRSPLSINDTIQCLENNRFVFRTVLGPNETRQWKINQKLIASGFIDSVVQTIGTPGNHTVTVVGNNASGCSDSSSVAFKVLASPRAQFIINNDTQCFDVQAFQLNDASSATDDNIQSWKYEIDDTLIVHDKQTAVFKFGRDGRYKASLFIVTEENCKDTVSEFLTVLPQPLAEIIGDTVCLGLESQIQAKAIGSSLIKSWKWYLGNGDSSTLQALSCLYDAVGAYDLRLLIVDQYGCTNTIDAPGISIVRPLPDAAFYTDIQDYGLNQVRLKFSPANPGYSQYLWLFPDGTTSALDTPALIISDLFKGETRLITINQYGCVDTSYKYNYIYPNNFNVYLPNAITVNGDLLNEQFKPVGIGATKTYLMRIYNRWGEEIFYTEDPEQGWDGTYQNEKVQQDVYTYYIEFTFVNGKVYRFKGTLTVLR